MSPRRISALVNLWGLVLVAPLAAWQATAFDFARVQAPTWSLLFFYSMAASVVILLIFYRRRGWLGDDPKK